ncbi:transposable element Tcb1 transposase [Trichonephila clavipes]|nr:transposable element Tcb1 transposase [Trichonephila clavipes]
MAIVFECEDLVVNASILPLLYSDTPLPQLVWGAIAYNTQSPLELNRGTMTTQRYVHDIPVVHNILQIHVSPLMQRLPGALFQQDTAWPYTARVSQDYLRTVITLPWPARIPDLSPIEHIWDPLGRLVGNLTSLNELEARLQQTWDEMSQDILQNLFASTPDYNACFIRARGDSTQGIKSSILFLFSQKNE